MELWDEGGGAYLTTVSSSWTIGGGYVNWRTDLLSAHLAVKRVGWDWLTLTMAAGYSLLMDEGFLKLMSADCIASSIFGGFAAGQSHARSVPYLIADYIAQYI